MEGEGFEGYVCGMWYYRLQIGTFERVRVYYLRRHEEYVSIRMRWPDEREVSHSTARNQQNREPRHRASEPDQKQPIGPVRRVLTLRAGPSLRYASPGAGK